MFKRLWLWLKEKDKKSNNGIIFGTAAGIAIGGLGGLASTASMGTGLVIALAVGSGLGLIVGAIDNKKYGPTAGLSIAIGSFVTFGSIILGFIPSIVVGGSLGLSFLALAQTRRVLTGHQKKELLPDVKLGDIQDLLDEFASESEEPSDKWFAHSRAILGAGLFQIRKNKYGSLVAGTSSVAFILANIAMLFILGTASATGPVTAALVALVILSVLVYIITTTTGWLLSFVITKIIGRRSVEDNNDIFFYIVTAFFLWLSTTPLFFSWLPLASMLAFYLGIGILHLKKKGGDNYLEHIQAMIVERLRGVIEEHREQVLGAESAFSKHLASREKDLEEARQILAHWQKRREKIEETEYVDRRVAVAEETIGLIEDDIKTFVGDKKAMLSGFRELEAQLPDVEAELADNIFDKRLESLRGRADGFRAESEALALSQVSSFVGQISHVQEAIEKVRLHTLPSLSGRGSTVVRELTERASKIAGNEVNGETAPA